MEEMQSRRIECITRRDRRYPERMRELPDMPERIYVLGNLPRDDVPSIAIIGARKSSYYGRSQASAYARYFSSLGIQVISGMALGIDGEAHRGALEGGTPTYAVLGCGVDICYPRSNEILYQKIQQKGGIISEQPPGQGARPGFFPLRNRIISALADVILVIEAREKSGSSITVNYALEQGKAVYALPGPVGKELSVGCHRLIDEGAGIAYTPEIILREWEHKTKKEENPLKKKKIGLAGDRDLVYSVLDLQPKSLNELAKKSQMSLQKTAQALIELELLGMITEVGKNYYRRNP